MGQTTNIPYVHHTFNPWWGCVKVSPGCDNCYAERWARRCGFDLWGPDAPRRLFPEKHWEEPLIWNKQAEKAGERRRVMCGSMCDVFELRPSAELDAPRERLWDLIGRTPALDWLLVTKRPENIPQLVPRQWAVAWPENVWAIVTAEDQDLFNRRIGDLLPLAARVRGLSIEPMLGPIFLPGIWFWLQPGCINWVIIGCEKLVGNRPGRQCQLTDVRDIVTDDPAEWPEDLRVQEFPK
jgi:protein gp37